MFHRYRRYFYRFNRKLKKMLLVKENLEVDLRESIISQITRSIDTGNDNKVSDEIRVHELRKAIKRIRALLRLLKPSLAKKSFYSIDEDLGKSARLLADLREATVNLRAFINLTNSSVNSIPGELKNLILQGLSNKINHSYNLSKNNFSTQIQASQRYLKQVKNNIENVSLRPMEDKDITTHIKKTYHKASSLYKDSLHSLDTEIIHKWRKFNKHLLFQLKYSPLEPDRKTGDMISTLISLSETLGNEHDLAIMEEYLQTNFNFIEADKRQLHLIVIKERNRLQKEAFKLGAKLYA